MKIKVRFYFAFISICTIFAMSGGRNRLTFKERQEMQQLEKELEVLNAEKAALEESLNSGMLKPDELVGKSQRLGEVIDLLDEKEMRWLELSELA